MSDFLKNLFKKVFFEWRIQLNIQVEHDLFMDPIEEKKIIDDIIKKRHLPYSIELMDVEGDKFTVRNNFGSSIVYVKKDDEYYLESEI